MCRLHLLIIFLGSIASLTAAPDGQQLFTQHCASCHGPQGTGDGPAAKYVYPKPRDFTRGTFKVRSTPDGTLPTGADLLKTITAGHAGHPCRRQTALCEDAMLQMPRRNRRRRWPVGEHFER